MRAGASAEYEGTIPSSSSKQRNAFQPTTNELRYRAEWWRSEIFEGQTPSEMLEAGRYRQLWLLAEAFCDPEERDVTDIEHIRD